MNGVKGFFVCCKNHRANTKHSREEVIAAVKNLKERQPQALLSVENLETVANMAEMFDEDKENDPKRKKYNGQSMYKRKTVMIRFISHQRTGWTST